MENFFYRFDFLHLQGGNKRPGFILVLSTSALSEMRNIEASDNEREELLARIRQELANSGLLSARDIKACGIDFADRSVCPIGFTTGGAFGASIVGDPDKLLRIGDPDVRARVGPEIRFSPHNIDQPKQALALLVMTQQWTEWAAGKLYELQLKRQHQAVLSATASSFEGPPRTRNYRP